MATAVPAEVAFARLQVALLDILHDTQEAMAEELGEVADKSLAHVHGSNEEPYLTGHTRGTLRKETDEFGFALKSDEPQAAVWNWGGTIEPRGAPITIPRTEFVTGRVEAEGNDIDEVVADRFDTIAHKHGFV